jgi:hypothetical protein
MLKDNVEGIGLDNIRHLAEERKTTKSLQRIVYAAGGT